MVLNFPPKESGYFQMSAFRGGSLRNGSGVGGLESLAAISKPQHRLCQKQHVCPPSLPFLLPPSLSSFFPRIFPGCLGCAHRHLVSGRRASSQGPACVGLTASGHWLISVDLRLSRCLHFRNAAAEAQRGGGLGLRLPSKWAGALPAGPPLQLLFGGLPPPRPLGGSSTRSSTSCCTLCTQGSQLVVQSINTAESVRPLCLQILQPRLCSVPS